MRQVSNLVVAIALVLEIVLLCLTAFTLASTTVLGG